MFKWFWTIFSLGAPAYYWSPKQLWNFRRNRGYWSCLSQLYTLYVWSKAKEFPGTKGTRNKVLRNKATERKKVTNKLQFNFIPRVLKGGNWLTNFGKRDTFECNHVNVIDHYPLTRRTISKNTTPLSVYFIFQAPSRYRRMCTYTVPSNRTSSRDHCSARLSV